MSTSGFGLGFDGERIKYMKKSLEDFNFKNHGTYQTTLIKSHIEGFSAQWGIDTSRQDSYEVHKDTVSYFLYKSDLLWKPGEHFSSKVVSDDSILLDLVEPIIKDLESKHRGKRGNVILIKLKARKNIPPHQDSGDYLMISRRNHIPIVSFSGVFFGVGEDRIPMREGECWEINNSRVHWVENNSQIDRIHLVIDIMPHAELLLKED